MSSAELFLLLSCVIPASAALLWLVAKPNHPLSSITCAILGIVIAAAGITTWTHPLAVWIPDWLAIGALPIQLGCDPLSSFFLLLLGSITTCCALFSPKYLEHLGERLSGRMYWSALFCFIGGMTGVVLAQNAVIFLVAWEVMSLASATLVLSEHQQQKAQRAGFIYIVATRIATIFIAAAFLLMYSHFNSWSFAAWHFDEPATWIAATFLLFGLSIKAGVWPCHIWLPYAHPEAPSPVSALMSGVMVKIAIYAMIRFFVVHHLTCQPLIYAMFIFACISSFWGVLFAINQREIKRLLAYSTVENVGLILIALSLYLWAKNDGLESIAQIAFIATLFHIFGHGLFKSLLFLGAGSVDYAAHSREFAALGGLMKNLPVTGALFLIGSAAICALPPLNGFASKWCIYQALLQASFTMHNVFDRGMCLMALGAMSAIGALAVACFAKAVGVSFLGRARSKQARMATEVPMSMRIAQTILALGCIGTGIGAQWLLPPLAHVITSSTGTTHVANIFRAIPLWQVAASLSILIAAIYALLLSRKPAHSRTWDCGFVSVPAKSQVTADSFAQPIARIFTPVLQYNLTVDISGRDRRHFPEKIEAKPSMVSLLETKVYGPAAVILDHLSAAVAKLQAGSIHLYLMYVCIALIVLVLLGTYLW